MAKLDLVVDRLSSGSAIQANVEPNGACSEVEKLARHAGKRNSAKSVGPTVEPSFEL